MGAARTCKDLVWEGRVCRPRGEGPRKGLPAAALGTGLSTLLDSFPWRGAEGWVWTGPSHGPSAIPSMQCLSQGTGAHGRPRRSAAMSPKVSLMPCRSAVLSPSPHMPEEGRDTRQWPPGPAQLRGRLPRGSHSPAHTLQGPDCAPQDPASPRVNICGRWEVG